MGNINISGSGRIEADGSLYDDVKISGSGTIDGNFHCKNVTVSGSGRTNGDIFCEGAVKVSGSGKFEGNVEADSVTISGSGHFCKNVKANSVRLSGSGHVNGSLKGGDITVSGSAHIDGEVSADTVKIGGSAHIGGLLNADQIDLSLGNCVISEIGCSRLDVHRSDNNFNTIKIFGISIFSSGGGTHSLKCGTIEGDELNLCYTEADVVRGKTVKVGEGCVIKKVEYSDSIEIAPDAKVGEQVKI